MSKTRDLIAFAVYLVIAGYMIRYTGWGRKR